MMTKVLDTEQRGYIDFKTFQARIKPRMSDQVTVVENESHKPNMWATREKLDEYGEKQKTLKDSIKEVNKVFRPDAD